MSGKLGRQQTKWYIQKVYPFYDEAYVIDKQRDVRRSTFCYRDYVYQVSKLQHMYAIDLILLSVLETPNQTRLYQI